MGKTKGKGNKNAKKTTSSPSKQQSSVAKNDTNTTQMPFISICTPTFNRRPFIPYTIKCFNSQTYPKDRIEWIIVDDGTDKIEDMVKDIPQVKYFKYEDKLSLGKKRNLMHSKCSGDIIVYMDDDDYYPPERVSHAVEVLQRNPNALCAGSSIMHIYFKHISKMYRFGPYGEKHATAATFAFRKKLLETTSYDESACLAEERHFLKEYTIPFAQLDTMKTILVFSHEHNSFDKKRLLNQGSNNPYLNESKLTPKHFINDDDVLQFFMTDIDQLLKNYEPGHPKNKHDVVKQTQEIEERRRKMMIEQQQNHMTNKINYIQNTLNNPNQNSIDTLTLQLQEVSLENTNMKNKINHLEKKISELIRELMKERMNNKETGNTNTNTEKKVENHI